MTIYLPLLKEKLLYFINFLPLLLFGLFFLTLFAISICNFEKAKKDLKKIMAKLFILTIAFFCIFQFLNCAGIIALIMYKDYRNCDFSYYSGEIDKVENSKSMSDGGVVIGGYKFLASLDMQKELRDYTGTECEIVYATKSKYIVNIIFN